MKRLFNPLVGCDPEVFLKDGTGIVSSIGLIGATKSAPLRVKEGAIHEDNVLAEINIDPAANEEEFVSRIHSVLSALKVHTGCDYEVKPSHHFSRELLMSQEKHGALSAGCERDYNVYTGTFNPKPRMRTTLRSGGGHIHVGCDDIDKERLVRTMDVLLGVPSVLMDDDRERRQLYGKAGSYRPKPYGIEYRVLSNFWLKDDSLIRWAYERTLLACEVHKTIGLPDENIVQECINTGNTALVEEINGYVNF